MGWQDVLQNIAGGASGVVSGLTKGADPFIAWDKVQAADAAIEGAGISNQKNQLQLEDLQKMQSALDNPDLNYYGNAAAAKDTTNRKSTAAGNLDIFGNQRQLDLQTYLADPNGVFQQGIKETGWEPGSPEYRDWLSEAISQFDPQGGVKAYDAYGVQKLQDKNLNEQAALQFIQAYAQKQDPNAVVTRKADGTVVIVSNGEEHPIQGDVITKLAAMISAKTPADAIEKGIASENTIQKTNVDIYKALTTGQITPAAAIKQLDSLRIGLNNVYQGAQRELEQLRKSDDYVQASPEQKLSMTQDLRERIAQAKRQLDANADVQARIAQTSSLPRLGIGGIGAPPGTPPLIRPQGTSSLNTRPAPGSIAARAAGIDPTNDLGAPWGASSEGPAYPTPYVDPNLPRNNGTGTSGKISSLDQVLQLLQQFGVA